MKLRVTFKSPDAADHAADEYAAAFYQDKPVGPEEESRERTIAEMKTEVLAKLTKWVGYGEYVTIEFDLEKMTATVVEKG